MRPFGIFKNILSGVILLMSLTLNSCRPDDDYVVVSGYAQGGTYTVKFNMRGVHQDIGTLRDSVETLLKSIDNSLSGYNRNSLLSRFNEGGTIRPDSLFLDIYQRSVAIFDQTDGAVDVAAGPLYDIWGFGFKNGELPSDTLVNRTLAGCGMRRMQRDMSTAVKDGCLSPCDMLNDHSGALPALNYNAVAQGYSCDVIARYLYSLGVKDMMVNIGEIFCDGLNPSGMPWTIGIDRPVDGNDEPGAEIQGIFQVPSGPHGVVTSGNYRKFYVRDGKKYAHTIDPRSGYPVSHNLLSATVIAPDATLADAYATYCMVIGLDASIEFVESHPELEACLVYDNDGRFCSWTSSGLQLQ